MSIYLLIMIVMSTFFTWYHTLLRKKDYHNCPQTHLKSMLKSLISLAISSASLIRYEFVHLISTNPIPNTSVKLAHDTQDCIAMIRPSMMVLLPKSTILFHLTPTYTLRVPSSSPTIHVWSLSLILFPHSPIPVHFWSRSNEDICHQQYF